MQTVKIQCPFTLEPLGEASLFDYRGEDLVLVIEGDDAEDLYANARGFETYEELTGHDLYKGSTLRTEEGHFIMPPMDNIQLVTDDQIMDAAIATFCADAKSPEDLLRELRGIGCSTVRAAGLLADHTAPRLDMEWGQVRAAILRVWGTPGSQVTP